MRRRRESPSLTPGHEENVQYLYPQHAQKENIPFLSLEETVGVSWLLDAFAAFYRILWMYLGIQFFAYQADLSSAQMLTQFFREQIQTASQMVFLFWVLMGVVFFPISTWFYAKFWTVLIKFFADLFERDNDENLDDIVNQVICQSLTAHSLYLIPIVGKSLSHFLGLFYLFVGLRQNFGFTNTQSALVIVSPLILMAITFFSFVAMFFLMFGLV